jgi:hypothetical protein
MATSPGVSASLSADEVIEMQNNRLRLPVLFGLSSLMVGCFQWTIPISDGDSGVLSTDAGQRRDAGSRARDGGTDAARDDAGAPVDGARDGGRSDGDADGYSTDAELSCRSDYCVDDFSLWDCSAEVIVTCDEGCRDAACVPSDDGGADGGMWLPCCVAGRVDSCYCAHGDICDPFSWMDCGDGSCVVGTTCPSEG